MVLKSQQSIFFLHFLPLMAVYAEKNFHRLSFTGCFLLAMATKESESSAGRVRNLFSDILYSLKNVGAFWAEVESVFQS